VGNNPVNFNDPDGLAAKIAGNWLDTQTHGYFSDFVDVGRDTLSLPGVQKRCTVARRWRRAEA
jgi:hypothetical protein